MTRISSLASLMAAFAIGFVAPSAMAAPLGSSAANLKTTVGENAGVEQVRHRCYRHRGHWHCPSHRHYYRYDDSPGFRFYFGDGRRHRHHRHHY